MALLCREPAEQLGDTTPGAFDTLPPLDEHPAVLEARAAVAFPRWMRWAAPVVVLLSLASAALWPLAYAPH